MSEEADGYNGPGKDEYLDKLAEYEEIRFNIMRLTSRAGKLLQGWEKSGGKKRDIQFGYDLRQLSPEEQRAEMLDRARVASYLGVISVDTNGQGSFELLFDAPPSDDPVGIGGAPLGSRLSLVRAMSAGFNDGKAKNGPGLSEGIKMYGWPDDSDEAMSYSTGWGDGFKERPAPKPPKADKKAGKSLNEEIAEELAAQEAVEAPKKRGRPPKKAPLALPAPEMEADFPEVPSGPVH